MPRSFCFRIRAALFFVFLFGTLLFAAEKATEAKSCFMWRASSGGTTVYLLGSMHVAQSDLYPLNPAIEKAWDVSDVLVLEIKMDAASQQAMQLASMKRGFYPKGDTLYNHISDPTRFAFEAFLMERHIPPTQLIRMRPWMLSVALVMQEYMRLGYMPTSGIDKHFQKKAEAAERTILGLETVEEQLEALAGGSDIEQELSLVDTFKQMPDLPRFMSRMTEAWGQGDAEALEKLIRETLSDDPRLRRSQRALFEDRNHRMAERIEPFFKTGKTHFVVVGSGHLVGKEGIPALLREKNYTVEQIAALPVKQKTPSVVKPKPAPVAEEVMDEEPVG